MSFQSMSMSLVGQVPGLPFPLAQSFLNESLGRIYDESQWSFQMAEFGWLTPGLLFANGSQSSGTITTVSYSNQVVGDTTASALWAAYNTAGTLPTLTKFQIRVPYYSVYSVIAYDTTSNPPFGTFTLNRPWMEPAGVSQAYMLYQCYFPVPVADFKKFFVIRDTVNNAPIDFWSLGQTDLMINDAQRVIFNQPAYAVPYEADARVGSPTLGNMLYELYGHPLSILPYTAAYLRRGPLLSSPTDTVPYPLTEELVMWRAKEVAYQWAESQKGSGVARGAGADFRFLSQSASAEYKRELKIIRDRDRDMFELYFNRYVRGAAFTYWGMPFATQLGSLNIGR